MDDVKVTKIEYPDKDGGINLSTKSPTFAILAAECVKMFKESGGVNYCEWRLNSGDPAFGTFTVIIQREDGKTVAQVNADLMAQRDAALLQNDEYRKALKLVAGAFLRPDAYQEGSRHIIAMRAVRLALERVAEKQKCEHKRLSEVVYDGNKRVCLDCEQDVIENLSDPSPKCKCDPCGCPDCKRIGAVCRKCDQPI